MMFSPLKLLFLLILSTLLTLTQSSTTCNPNDHKTLLQIKTHFHNAPSLSSWNPKTDCCTWTDVGCNDSGRVISLTIAGSNDIVGQIPPVIGNLPYLFQIRFYDLPNLTGPVPQTLTKLTRLQNLILNSNRLTGSIPVFLSQIKSLEILDLSSNSFSGPIPSSLSLLPNIFELDLFRNKLTGSIPESFGSFKTGLTLQVFENQLSGSLPRSLGRANLTTLDVSGNRFTGDVSFLFGKDKSLDTLILRDNRFMFDFSNVDLPHGLKGLDMAHNKIYGSLPKRLGQLPLSFIDVSYNQLCGPIPTGRRIKRFKPVRFAHNKCLCGVPLPPCK